MSDLTKQSELFNEESYLLGALRTIVASAKAARPSELAEIARSAIAHVERHTRPASAGVREALEESKHWHEQQDKALSKSGRGDADYYWHRAQHRQEIERIDSALSDHGVQKSAGIEFDFRAHLQRQRDWSGKTFGPGDRAKGVVDHIRKELREIEADPSDLTEWIDVAILALDGAWRSGASPEQIISTLVEKQTKNEKRVWPDWRTSDPNKAIEHDRSAVVSESHLLSKTLTEGEQRSIATKQSTDPTSASGLSPAWRTDMENAPRDGTKIDLLYPYPRLRFIDAQWCSGGVYGDGGWYRFNPRWGSQPGLGIDWHLLPESEWAAEFLPNMEPTHWMPLPPAPTLLSTRMGD